MLGAVTMVHGTQHIHFRCRVRNWRTYNQALIARGEITFWIEETALAAAKHPGSQWVWCTQDLLGYGDTLRGGRQERLRPQLASRSRFCILGDESDETRSAGAEL